ncbi:hypothetical protein WR25_09538 [Diploscapter pachys]|uniref:HTH asnC-type domain-containing protein n=1 Tax=Diploscapter pachys TaxID=2018661 RepID=A0A2A2KGC7_9BILA|nr:hypothetical protein WR25_09538 [Diploscapter pachys]
MPATSSITLDAIDRQLISLLQINARESVATLARQLGIARTTVNSRLERLERNKVITGYGVRLGQRLIGGGLQAYVGIKAQPRSGKDIVRHLSAMGQVQQLCAHARVDQGVGGIDAGAYGEDRGMAGLAGAEGLLGGWVQSRTCPRTAAMTACLQFDRRVLTPDHRICGDRLKLTAKVYPHSQTGATGLVG